jgi:phage head maturation protease
MINKIYRSAEITSESGRYIEGYAVVFNVMSADLGGFREIIRPSAITQELIDSSDIIANMNHRDDYMMARLRNGKGNIDLTID